MNPHNKNQPLKEQLANQLLLLLALCILGAFLILILFLSKLGVFTSSPETSEKKETPMKYIKPLWKPISLEAAWREPNKDLIEYGHELITNTAFYLGPKGKIRQISNGMNCQNCHLDAGTRPWGNNYGAVAATYPKFRERSGTKESIIKRVNDCMERSLNGQALDSSSKEMQAMISYIKFLGSYVPKDSTPAGTGIWKLKFLNRAADPIKGQIAYEQKCVSCHGKEGAGVKNADGKTYTYPPLWGTHSYNIGAGLFRLSRFAGYIKTNMPFGATYEQPQLSDEEAWDIAAFVNSQARPTKDLSHDWPNIAGKSFDHPFGPYADPFSEEQHKFGPFQPIVDFKKAHKSK